MDKDDDTTELIESMHKSVDALESLIRDGRVPDTPPVDGDKATEWFDAYNTGFDKGYRAHKHDSVVPSLLYALAGLVTGLLAGWAV